MVGSSHDPKRGTGQHARLEVIQIIMLASWQPGTARSSGLLMNDFSRLPYVHQIQVGSEGDPLVGLPRGLRDRPREANVPVDGGWIAV